MKIRAIVHPAEEGGYWAEVPALPGCVTEGDTMEEVVANLQDAIEGWLDVANIRKVIEPADWVVEIEYPIEAIVEMATASFLDVEALGFVDCEPGRGQ